MKRGILVMKGNKGSGMGLFSVVMAFLLLRHLKRYQIGESFGNYILFDEELILQRIKGLGGKG